MIKKKGTTQNQDEQSHARPDMPLVVNDELVHVPADVYESMSLEAASRGISIVDVYLEEVAAAAVLETIAPTEDELQQLAAKSQPPQKYLQGDEECPF